MKMKKKDVLTLSMLANQNFSETKYLLGKKFSRNQKSRIYNEYEL